MNQRNTIVNASGRRTWQRLSVVRMGASDAEGNVMMSMLADSVTMMMMGS